MLRKREKSHDSVSSVSESDDGEERILGVYWRRWMLLFILSMLVCISNWVCFSLSAIEDAALGSYPELNLSLLVSVFNVSNILGSLVEPWILDHYDLRDAVVGGAFLMLLGNCTKSIVSGDSPISITLLTVAHFFVGLSQPIFQMTSLVLCQDWFPTNERSFVTAVLINFNQIGICWAFIGGKLIVGSNPDEMMFYMYLMTLSSAVFFFLALIFFKPLPPLPPSRSAAEKRKKLLKDKKKAVAEYWIEPARLLRDKNFLIVTITYCASSAAANVIATDLSFLLNDDESTNLDVTYVATTFLLFMVIGAFIVGWQVNKEHSYRETTLILLGLSTISSLLCGLCLGFGLFVGFWFFLLFFGLVAGPGKSTTKIHIFFTSMTNTGIDTVDTGMPIQADLGVEVVFPQPENDVIFILMVTSNGANTVLIWVAYIFRNVAQTPYLSLLYILSILSIFTFSIFWAFFDGQYLRMKFDSEKTLSPSDISPIRVYSA